MSINRSHHGTRSAGLKGRAKLSAVAAACLVAAAFGTASQSAAADPIRIFLPTSPIAWGFYLADKKGYFKAEGVDATVRVFSSGAEGGQAFQALGAEMLEAGDMPALLFVNRTSSTTTLIGQVAQSSKGMQLIGPTSIKGPADLKGKKIATNLGSTTEYYLTKYLKENGLEGQVTVVNLDPGSQVPALIRGDVDAIMSFLEVGVRALSSNRYHLIGAWGSSLMLAASRKVVAEQPAAIEAILRALKRSAADVKADQKAALGVVSGSYGLTDAAYQGYLSYGGIDLTPQYSAETHAFLQDISTFLVQQKKLPQPFDFCRNLDLRFLSKVSPQAVSGKPKC
jgi:ABC-type nitrate/sulfonate/bicarbonate transport system substrate-binding protein